MSKVVSDISMGVAMNNWGSVRSIIMSKRLGSRSWASDRKHLLQIIDAAEQFGLDSTHAEQASLSNLRTIIKPARRAILATKRQRLSQLFLWAAILTTAELRVRVGAHVLQEILYKTRTREGETLYEILATSGEFERIQRMTKPQYSFVPLEDDEHRSAEER